VFNKDGKNPSNIFGLLQFFLEHICKKICTIEFIHPVCLSVCALYFRHFSTYDLQISNSGRSLFENRTMSCPEALSICENSNFSLL
jgi:hypothetical protein